MLVRIAIGMMTNGGDEDSDYDDYHDYAAAEIIAVTWLWGLIGCLMTPPPPPGGDFLNKKD